MQLPYNIKQKYENGMMFISYFVSYSAAQNYFKTIVKNNSNNIIQISLNSDRQTKLQYYINNEKINKNNIDFKYQQKNLEGPYICISNQEYQKLKIKRGKE